MGEMREEEKKEKKEKVSKIVTNQVVDSAPFHQKKLETRDHIRTDNIYTTIQAAPISASSFESYLGSRNVTSESAHSALFRSSNFATLS